MSPWCVYAEERMKWTVANAFLCSRSRGNSLRATVETSWRQFSVKLLFSLFASQLEIRPYTHLVQLVYTHHTWHSIKKLTVGIKCRQHWIFEYFTLNIISSIPLQEV
ncbi:hypothetical protein SORBI_3006G146600 [Sorghum bicolor]|uniref:Uncharacterized protein n=1 Tax=Sorghum bicolor TaxID=4558 RepID=A0A1Z5REV1_SORBI|nr:hypothetical protein SORBI_3006G146600 [Sorghum bicolor]